MKITDGAKVTLTGGLVLMSNIEGLIINNLALKGEVCCSRKVVRLRV